MISYKEWIQENGLYKCPDCGREFSLMGIRSHYWRMHTEKGKKNNPNIGYKLGTRHGWNKGLKKENNDKIRQMANTYKENYKNGKIVSYMKGKHHSQEMKDRISKSRIKYLNEHPDKVPYKLNHYTKRQSYPEKYFDELFAKEGVKLEKCKQVGFYELDYCDLIKKIYIEIDGEQHYVDKRITESDIRRTKYLEELGWKGFRIRWSEYAKMSHDEKHQVVETIKQLLNKTEEELKAYKEYVEKTYGADYSKLYDDARYKKEQNKCVICGTLTNAFYFCSKKCMGIGINLIGKRAFTKSEVIRKILNVENFKGKRNYMFEKCWIHNNNLKVNYCVKKDELEKFVRDGWNKGRKMEYGNISIKNKLVSNALVAQPV